MSIWVDADACPGVIKDILFRAAERTETPVTLVANQPIRTPRSRYVTSVQVAKGFDVADNEIVRRCAPGDLVITSDIPLAARAMEKGAHALRPNGRAFTQDNIGMALAMRELNQELRETGEIKGHNPAFTAKDRSEFLQALENLIQSLNRTP